jgi:hypothetical protein
VTVSIEELLRLEQRRVEDEAAARRAREHADRQTAEEAAARARAEEDARRREAEARRERETAALGEREARLHAIRDAEIVRARLEAEAAARLDALRATHAYEERLAAARNTGRARGGARAVHAILVLLALTWAAGAWSARRTAAQMTDDRAWARAASAEARGAVDGLQRALDRQADAIADVRARVDALPRPDVLAAALPAARDPGARGAPTAHVGGIARPLRASGAGARCKDGDPMCSDLP